MIIEIKVSNYRSINAEQTISFVADKSRRLPDNLTYHKGFRLLKAIGIFGANAAGKSNFVKAIREALSFIKFSATRFNEGDLIPYSENHKFGNQLNNLGSGFEISFQMGAQIYRYGFTSLPNRISSEYLYQVNSTTNNDILLIKRLYSIEENSYEWYFDKNITEHSDLLQKRTRSNSLFLSSAARENIPILTEIYAYLRTKTTNIDMCGSNKILLRQSIRYNINRRDVMQRALDLINELDIDIESIKISNFESSLNGSSDVRGHDQELDEIPTNNMEHKLRSADSIIARRVDQSGKIHEFNFWTEESEGTQRLFSLAGHLLIALETGSLLVVDEFDAGIHPLITRSIIERFQSSESNKNGAQLLFTTHDSGLLDNQIFRRDQIWLAEKRNNASEYFSLADIVPPPRNTEAYLKNYMAGRYGGTPQIVISANPGLSKAEE